MTPNNGRILIFGYLGSVFIPIINTIVFTQPKMESGSAKKNAMFLSFFSPLESFRTLKIEFGPAVARGTA